MTEKGKQSIFDVAQTADEENKSYVIQRTGSEARCCQIQRRFFQFKLIDFHKTKFSSSEIFIWLERSFRERSAEDSI